MKQLFTSVVAAGALTGILTGAAAAQGSRCTRETLSVRGVPLTASYCISSETTAATAHDISVAVAESYVTARGSLSQQNTLQFISGENASRFIEDVPLTRLGLADASQAAFVGDSYDRDVVPAKAIGMTTAWLIGDAVKAPPDPAQVDFTEARQVRTTAQFAHAVAGINETNAMRGNRG